MKLLIVIIAVLFVVQCYAIPTVELDNSPIPIVKLLTTDDFANAIERFRLNMRTGVGENNVILSPLLIDFIDSNFTLAGVFDFQGPLENIRIDGLDGFIVTNLNYNDNTRRLDYAITIPALIARGIYNLVGRFSGLIPVFGNGNFMIAPVNYRFNGYLEFSTDANNYVQLSEFYSRLAMDSLDTIITNLMFGGELGDLVNYIIQDITPSTMNRRHTIISRDIKNRVMPWANERLNGLTWNDFVNIILPPVNNVAEPRPSE